MSSNQSPNEIIYVKRSAPKYKTSAMTVKGKVHTTGVGEDLEFNPKYFCTKHGVIKLIQLVS